MAVLYIVNQDLVTPTTFENRLQAGTAAAAPATTTLVTPPVTTPAFTPIGIGKPLSIEIMTIYVGNKMATLLDKDKNVLLVSGVKAISTFNAVARAMNFTKKNVTNFQYPDFSAVSDGTPIVYYTQALDTETISVTFEFIADNFNQDIFDDIAKLFTEAASLPVFLPATGYLLAGSAVIKTAGALGNTLFQKPPFLSETIPLRFGSPLFPIPESQLMLVCNDSDLAELKACTINVDTSTPAKVTAKLIGTDGKPYQGDKPYLIISLDGRERKDLEKFTPTLATSAILSQFYGTGDNATAITTTLQDAMSLYNDSTYNKKATELKNEMSGLAQTSAEYIADKQLFDAYNKNIQTDVFKVTIP